MNRRAKMHMTLTIGWMLLAIPGLLLWRDSVGFVVAASIYANVVGHWSAVEAARES